MRYLLNVFWLLIGLLCAAAAWVVVSIILAGPLVVAGAALMWIWEVFF